jgi:hypothetical protein
MKIQDIYQQYQIMPSLQEHMLTVAAVAAEICDHFQGPVVDKSSIVSACLLHDMGNIIKFDLTRFPDFLKPKGLDYWQKIKEDYIERYGDDEFVASELIVEEINVTPRVKELIQAISLLQAKENHFSSDYGRKICEYADNRVSPWGITSLSKRLDDLADRYQKTHPIDDSKRGDLFNYSLKMEKQIFQYCNISPDEITKSRVSDTIDSLKSFVVSMKS